MANSKASVLIGNVNGRLSEVFGKLVAVQSKQSFAFAIIAGNLFADPAVATEADEEEVSKLLSGAIKVALPTYFTVGSHPLPPSVVSKLEASDGELCPNLIVLGRRVAIKTSQGIRIVALSGTHEPGSDNSMNEYKSTYTDADIATLVKDPKETDILVTSDWPEGIQKESKVAYDGEPPKSVQGIADLCVALKPKYHFTTSSAFYEREAFQHPVGRTVTRFISLAAFGNSEKQKWIYAFSLQPSTLHPPIIPQGCTRSPFATPKKRRLDSQQNAYDNYRYAHGGGNQQWESDHGRGKRRRHQRQPPGPQLCFFCLSNENCETHMIGSIGDSNYLTVAKGPLTMRSTFPQLGFPGHVLIIPVSHIATIPNLPEDARALTKKEMERYRDALQNMIAAKSKDEDGKATLGAVTWEINRASGVHLHWQFLPVPVDLVERDVVEAGFVVEAENLDYPRFEKKEAEMAEMEENDHFKVTIWSENKRTQMILPLDLGFKFDLQFGRRVLAKLLGLDGRMDWKTCVQSKEEESADAEVFKATFKEFDFSLQE